jgi:hypothetical protein
MASGILQQAAIYGRVIAEAYWCRKASFRQLAKRFDTSVGTVQRCALAYKHLLATISATTR